MKVLLREVRHYNVTCGERDLGTFRLESAWEGLIKLVDNKGRSMVVEQPSGMKAAYAQMLDESVEALVLKASSDFL